VIRGDFVWASSGVLQSFQIEGHQTRDSGSPALLCAVVSSTVRSFIRLCQGWKLSVKVAGDERGRVSFEIKELPLDRDLYKGACAVLWQVFQDLEQENPTLIKVQTIDVSDLALGLYLC
jgi:uncharacterized protein YsxB (DUF464 family)